MAVAQRRIPNPAADPIVPVDRPSAGSGRRLDSVPAAAGGETREAHRRVLDAAVEAGGLAATIGAIADLTDSPAVLQDPFLTVLIAAPRPGDDNAEPPAGIALSRSGGAQVRELLRDADRPMLVELPRSGQAPPRLAARISARGELLGFLLVGAVDRAAYATLEAAAPVVALLLQAEDRLCRALERDQREFFLDLLAGGRSAECLVIQGRRLGHDLEQPHWPVVFRAEPDAEGDTGEPTARLADIVREALRDDRGAGRPAPVVGVDGDAVVAFLPGCGDSPAAVADRARTLAARRGLVATAGWGPRCDDLDAFGAGVARARWVVDVLGHMPGRATTAGYDDLGIYALLYEKRDQDQLADFAARWLGPLQDHGDLLATLRVLLETGGPSAAATELFVHISTLKYRLRKIESILGVDLSDPEVGFNLRLAFKIVAVQERLAGIGPA